MKLGKMLVVCVAVAIAPAAIGQKWEFGGGVGGGFYTSQDVTAPGGSVAAKIQNNVAGSVWLDNNGRGHWSGELRYDYQTGDLSLSSGATQATFGALSHAFHYDFLWSATPNGSRVRPFLAAGGGIKLYQGTGTEVAFQPLSNFALLTKVQDVTPLISVGAGIKAELAPRVQLRVELHDYLTTFPNKVIVPNQGAHVGGWLQDFVPSVGLSFLLGRVE